MRFLITVTVLCLYLSRSLILSLSLYPPGGRSYVSQTQDTHTFTQRPMSHGQPDKIVIVLANASCYVMPRFSCWSTDTIDFHLSSAHLP